MAELKAKQGKAAPRQESVPLSDIFFTTLRHWPWIILSVAVCVGIAAFSVYRRPLMYTESAEILIKDDDPGESPLSGEEFSTLGLVRSNPNLYNEISNLHSKDLMEQVVRRLSLDMQYFTSGTLHDNAAYGASLPVTVTAPGLSDESVASFSLVVSPNGDVRIENLEKNGKRVGDGTFAGRLGVAMDTPVGKMLVHATPYYSRWRSTHKGEDLELKVRKQTLTSVRDSYISRLTVANADDKGSSVLRLSVADTSTERADDVLKTLIAVYNEDWVRDKNMIAVSTSNFINDRLGVIESELGNVDSDISSYKSANLIPDVDAAASMYMTRSQKTQDDILGLENQLQMARYIRSYVSSDANRDQLMPTATGISNASISSLIAEYNTTLLQRNALVEKSSDENPLVRQLDQQLAAQRKAVTRTIDNEILSISTRLSALQGSERQITSQIASNPTQAKNLLSVERQQKVKESLYLFLLQKREENELSQAFTAYNTKVVNRPGPSGLPPTPSRSNTLLIAFLAGLAIPFGVTFATESLNTRVRGRKDVENLAVPFLGEIPLEPAVAGKDSKPHTVLVKQGSRNLINEAFRVLRTNLEFISANADDCRVVAVTSFNPGSGKSFITANLGVSLAIKGRRVLIVDGDMRHGSLSAYFGSPKEGLSDYLSGAADYLPQLIVTSKEHSGCDILPVGKIPPNPTELLELPRFREMVGNLRTQYDYILIDCPPIEVVADAQIIDREADRTLFIVRAGILERSMLPELDALYEEKKYKNMAMILNGTRSQGGRYASRYSYRYGYTSRGYAYNYDSSGSNH